MDYTYFSDVIESKMSEYGLTKYKSKIIGREKRLKNYGAFILCERIENFRLVCKDITKKVLALCDDELIMDNDDKILLFLEVYPKKDKECEILISNNKNEKAKLDKYYNEIVDEEIQRIRDDYLNKKRPRKPELPKEYAEWFLPPVWQKTEGDLGYIVCESTLWEEKIQDFSFSLDSINRMIINIVDDFENHNCQIYSDDYPNLYIMEGESCSILYTISLVERKSVLFLILPIGNDAYGKREPASIFDSFDRSIISFLSSDINGIDVILRIARRAYPFDILLEKSEWLKIEQDKEANLALSSEEENLLLTISNPPKDKTSLPIFINGRAGSGKSTMMLYLFSIFCYRKLFDKMPGIPLYITYNEMLLNHAKKGVESILRSHHSFVNKSVNTEKNFSFSCLFDSFKTFRPLMLGLLPDNLKDDFAYCKRLTYSGFKDFMNKQSRYRKLQYSSETIWHVIRTFIKGRDYKCFLDPIGYDKIASKDKTVDMECYTYIYENVWKNYMDYLNEKSLWDDQDLVRVVLKAIDKNEIRLPEYSSVFCDEAQDFTNIELGLVLKLSLYSKYDMSDYIDSLASLPFAFAGDPLQTITPTGFSWDRFISMFYNELERSLSIKNPQRFTSDKNKELKYNYRSGSGIVKFSNLLQFFRKEFTKEKVSPQKTWFEKDLFPPMKFILESNLSDIGFINKAKDTVIIIPADEDNEKEYISSDKLLNIMIKDVEKQSTVFNAINAKGLEFDKVIVYKFGQYYADNSTNSIREKMQDCLSNDIDFKDKYFLNRLYVALTRAKKQLYIVDTIEGNNYLWKDLQKNKLSDLASFNIWEDEMNDLIDGSEDNLQEEGDPLKNARYLFIQGIQQANTDFLKKAMFAFEKAGEQDEVIKCSAWINKFDENYREAGRLFESFEPEEAKKCYWDGKLWEDLIRWYNEKQMTIQDIECKIALFMTRKPRDFECIDQFVESGFFLIEGYSNYSSVLTDTEQYEEAVRLFVDQVYEHNEQISADIRDRLNNMVLTKKLEKYYLTVIELYFSCKDYHKVVDLCEELNYRDLIEYQKAKAYSSDYPEKIKYLNLVGHTEQVVDEYIKNNNGRESSQILQIALECCMKHNKHKEALRIMLILREWERAKKLLHNEIEVFSGDLSLVEEYFSLLIQNRNVEEIIKTYFDLFDYDENSKNSILAIIFRIISYSDFTPDKIEKSSHRARVFSLINEFFTHTRKKTLFSDYSFDLKQAGSCYERLGCKYKDMMVFYEKAMGSATFVEYEIIDWESLLSKLKNQKNPQYKYFWDRLSPDTKVDINNCKILKLPSFELREMIISDFNKICNRKELWDIKNSLFDDIDRSPIHYIREQKKVDGYKYVNRYLIESVFDGDMFSYSLTNKITSNKELLQFVRERWLFVKAAFTKEFSKDKEAKDKNIRELTLRKNEWGIASIPVDFYVFEKPEVTQNIIVDKGCDLPINKISVDEEGDFMIGKIKGNIHKKRSEYIISFTIPKDSEEKIFHFQNEERNLSILNNSEILEIPV